MLLRMWELETYECRLNFILSQAYNAKLSDFGLAKEGPSPDQTHVSTRVVGTVGYAAPEYIITGN